MTQKNDFSGQPPIVPGISPLYFGLMLVIVLAGFVAGAALGFFGRPLVVADKVVEVPVTATPQATAVTQVESGTPPTIMDMVMSDARHIQGDAGAPVTIVEFSDFKCGYCGRFATDTLAQLRKTYVDTGKAKLAYKHFAVLGPESGLSAEASECAAEQNAFWQFHDQVFADQVMTHSQLTNQSLTAMAVSLGLDGKTFGECLDSGKYANQIRQEALSVQSLGVRGTPAFLINGVFVSGAQPFEVFQQIIEEQLAALP